MTPLPEIKVRVGLGWSVLDRESVGSPPFMAAMEEVDAAGWDSIWLSDTALRAGASPLPVLAAVAMRTKRLKLGTSVLVAPPRNPVLLAKELATIDVLSGGRFLPAFGIGIDTPEELAALGLRREERVGRLVEAVEVIQALWTGEPVTYHGRYVTLDGAVLTPRPTRRKLEIWLSGESLPALRRTGRIGYGWLASYQAPEEFGERVATIRAAAAEAGREVPADHFGVIVFAARDEEEAALFPGGPRMRPELRREDIVGIGVDGVRALLQRFVEQGASKFVLSPLAREPLPFLRELKREVVDPLEAAGLQR